MSLPFTPKAFLQVFVDYNQAVWPAQVFLYFLAVVLTGVAHRGRGRATRWVALGLAGLWAWMGLEYHIGFFRIINPAALGFGIAFLVQAWLFLVWGVTTPNIAVGEVKGGRAWLGGAMLAYALAFYPLLGWLLGHRFHASATVGLPCPTTIATLGLLVWVRPRPPWWLWVVPLAWAVVGSSAAFALGMWEDLGLLAAGVAAAAWWWRDAWGHHQREAPMNAKRRFSIAEARAIGMHVGIDWTTIDLEQFRRGLEVELEHGSRDPETNVTNDDPYLTAKIAWAHLREIPDYYARLEVMEAAASR
ncbi:MAG TPA: DUF6064 family protein [Gemmatimonadales bacterium]|nr:DUF6064 family protein [Gemmatimonadales bacterium]